MKEQKQQEEMNDQKAEETITKNQTDQKLMNPTKEKLSSQNDSFDSLMEEQEFQATDHAIPNHIDEDYQKIKRVIRHRKWWTLATIVAVVLLLMYVIPWVIHRHNIGKIYNIYTNELTQKEDPQQIYRNKMIENELHSPETYMDNFHFGEQFSSSGLERRTISWQLFDTLNYRKEFASLYAFENDMYCISYEYDNSENLGNVMAYPACGSSDSLKKFYSDQYITLFKMVDYQNYWHKEEFDHIPDHSFVGAYVKFKEQLSLEEILALDKRLKAQDVDMGLRWVSVFYNGGFVQNANGLNEEEREQAYQGILGFDIFHPDNPPLFIHYNQTIYPYLMIQKTSDQNPHATIQRQTIDYDNVSTEIYEKHFCSMLQYLYDQPNYIKYLGDDQAEEVAKYPTIIEQVKTKGIHTNVIYVTTTKEDLQELMEQKEVKSAFISGVK